MIKSILILIILTICNFASAGEKYTYDIPISYSDGSVLLLEDIDSYIIEYSIDGVEQPDFIISDPSCLNVGLSHVRIMLAALARLHIINMIVIRIDFIMLNLIII